MSIKLLSQIWELETSGNERAVLQVLCDYANDDGVCWPSIPSVAWKVGCSEQTVRNILAVLYDKGALVKIEDGGGRAKTNTYRVNLDAFERKPPRAGNPLNPQTTIGGFIGFSGNPQNPQISDETPKQLFEGNRHREPSNSNESTPTVVDSLESAPEKKSTKARPTRMYPAWEPAPLPVGKFQISAVEMERQLDLFRDHFLGTGEAKADWNAAWRNWLRRAPSFDRKPASNGRHDKFAASGQKLLTSADLRRMAMGDRDEQQRDDGLVVDSQFRVAESADHGGHRNGLDVGV